MNEPLRILDDPAVAADVRSHLDRARAAKVPIDLDAGLVGLQAKIAAPPAAAAATTGLGVKLGALLGAVLAVAALVYALTRPRAPVPPTVAPVVPASSAEVAPPVETKGEPPIEPEPSSLPSAAPSQAPSARSSAPPAASSSSSSDDPDLLRAEAEHLATLRGLVRSDPAAAVAAANEGHRRFAHGGVLYPEREALAVIALAATGRKEEAQRRGKALLAANPKGPRNEQVRAAIQDP